jgi:hypothetical protein
LGYQNKNSYDEWKLCSPFSPGTEFGILAGRLTEASGGFLFRKINQFKSKNIGKFH